MTLEHIEKLMRAVEGARGASAKKLGKDNQILKDFFETLHEFRKELLTHVNDTAILIDARDTARLARDEAVADLEKARTQFGVADEARRLALEQNLVMRKALQHATETLEQFAEPWKDLQCDCDTERACSRHNAVQESLDRVREAMKGTP